MCLANIWPLVFLESPHHPLDRFWGPQDGDFGFSSGGYQGRGACILGCKWDKQNWAKWTPFEMFVHYRIFNIKFLWELRVHICALGQVSYQGLLKVFNSLLLQSGNTCNDCSPWKSKAYQIDLGSICLALLLSDWYILAK